MKTRTLQVAPQDSSLRSQDPPAFTTIELLVSMAVMIVAMVGVVSVFNISSGAAAKTAGHAELIEASAALQSELTHQLSHIASGLLVIESPPPTTLRAETPGGTKWLRLRHDRLVFIASGSANEFQSFTDPRRGIPSDPEGLTNGDFAPPASSSESLEYFGPGVPLQVLSDGSSVPRLIDGATPDTSLAASEWTFAHRSILLMQNGAVPTPHPSAWDTGGPLTISNVFFTNPNGMLFGGPLDPRYYNGVADLIFADVTRRADAPTLIDEIRTHAYPFDSLAALWQANLSPVSASLIDALNGADYYSRSGFTFLPRLADVRIEWTDGRRIDPCGVDNDPTALGDNDSRTRWFGLAPQRNGPPPDPANPATIASMQYQARMRFIADPLNPSNPNASCNPDNPTTETAAFANIEYGYNPSGSIGVTPDQDAGYRAVWRTDNWQYRPKALRITYRLYDAGLRIQSPTNVDLNENGILDPDDSNQPRTTPAALVSRYGQEFSIVVAVP